MDTASGVYCKTIERRQIRRTADHECWPVHRRQATVCAWMADRTYTFDVSARIIGLCRFVKYCRAVVVYYNLGTMIRGGERFVGQNLPDGIQIGNLAEMLLADFTPVA